MKINCRPWRKARLEKWHLYFALRPRRVGPHDCRWLEWVERRGDWDCQYGWFWQYRAKGEK